MTRIRLTAPLFLILTVGACTTSTDRKSAAPSDCLALAKGTTAAQPGPIIAVLSTIADTDHSEQLRMERRNAFERIVRAGFSMTPPAWLLSGEIGQGVGEHNFTAGIPLVAEGPNKTLRDRNKACKIDRLTQNFTATLDQRSGGPSDIFTGLKALQGQLTGLPGRGTTEVVLMSTMLSGAQPLALEKPTTLATDPYDLYDELEMHRLLPDCRGWRVYIAGAGRAAAGGVDAIAASQLQDFWTVFFSRCGGTVVAYQTQLGAFPVDDNAAPLVPPPPRPPKIQWESSSTQFSYPVPSRFLFDIGKADIRDEANSILSELLAVVQRDAQSLIEVAGHTDSTGLPDFNHDLSERRAKSVREWLIAQGVSEQRIRAVGYGSQFPRADNGTPEGRILNRRVEITISFAS